MLRAIAKATIQGETGLDRVLRQANDIVRAVLLVPAELPELAPKHSDTEALRKCHANRQRFGGAADGMLNAVVTVGILPRRAESELDPRSVCSERRRLRGEYPGRHERRAENQADESHGLEGDAAA